METEARINGGQEDIVFGTRTTANKAGHDNGNDDTSGISSCCCSSSAVIRLRYPIISNETGIYSAIAAAPYLRESLTRSRPEELIEMKGVPSFPMDETESTLSEASLLKRSHNLYRSRSEETEETNISPRDSLIPSLDSRHKVLIIESTYSADKGNSEEALLTACGAGVTLAESESSNASVTEYSSLIKFKPPKE